jgi:hypothetical protein
MGSGGSIPGVKRPEREADHSPPSSTEVKNAWSYTSTPLYVFMTWRLVKHRDSFTFYIYLYIRVTLGECNNNMATSNLYLPSGLMVTINEPPDLNYIRTTVWRKIKHTYEAGLSNASSYKHGDGEKLYVVKLT